MHLDDFVYRLCHPSRRVKVAGRAPGTRLPASYFSLSQCHARYRFSFELPESLIAHYPMPERSSVVYCRWTGRRAR